MFLKQVNGEIYNHEELRRSLPNHKFKTGSDCDVIAHLVSCSVVNNVQVPRAEYVETTDFIVHDTDI